MTKKTLEYIEVRFGKKALLLTDDLEEFSVTSELVYLLLRVVIEARHRHLPLPKAYSIGALSLERNHLPKNVSYFANGDGFLILETNASDEKLKTKYDLSPDTLLCHFSKQHFAQEEIQELIMAKASVNPTDYYRTEPPLLMAAKNLNTKTVQILLEHKADPSCIMEGKNALDFLIHASDSQTSDELYIITSELLMMGVKPHHKLPDTLPFNITELLIRANIQEKHFGKQDYQKFFLLPFAEELIKFYLNFLFEPLEIIFLIIEYYANNPEDTLKNPYFLGSPIAESGIIESKTYFLEEIKNYLKAPAPQHVEWLNHLIKVLDQPNFYSRHLTQPLSMPEIIRFHLRSFIRCGGTLLNDATLYKILEKLISQQSLEETIKAGQEEYKKSNPISRALAERDIGNYTLFRELTNCKKIPTDDFKISDVSDFSQRLLAPPDVQILANQIKTNLATALQPLAPHLKLTAPQIMQDLKIIITLQDFLIWSNKYKEKISDLSDSLTGKAKESVSTAIDLIDQYLSLVSTLPHPVSPTQNHYCRVM